MKNIAKDMGRKAYFRSPTFAQKIALQIIPEQRLLRKHVQETERNQWLTTDQLEQLQCKKLRRIIHHAYENVPYYRRVFDQRRLKPDDIQSLNDLKKLPILTKDDVRQYFKELQATNMNQYEPYLSQTGGSTGTPLQFYNDKVFRWEESLVVARFRHWMQLGSEHPKRVVMRYKTDFPPTEEGVAPHQRIDNTLYLSSFHLQKNNLDDDINRIRAFKPRLIWSFPSVLYILADHMRENRIPPIASLKAINTSAETLFPHFRKAIEEAFGAKVYDHYGSNEGVVSAWECPNGSLHIDVEYGILELVDTEGMAVPIGKPGIVVGTGLNKFAMPLIRYSLGDIAIMSNEPCPCDRRLPVISSLEGRSDDVVITKDGRLVGRLDSAFRKSYGIMMSQIVQEEPGRIIVRIVKRKDYSDEDTKILDAELRELLGKDMIIEYRFVDDIERVGMGKYKFVISKLDRGGSHP